MWRGSNLYLLHERGFDVIGIHISEPLVEKARSLFPGIDFRVEDIRDTSFDPAAFDYVIFSFFGLNYVLPKSRADKSAERNLSSAETRRHRSTVVSQQLVSARAAFGRRPFSDFERRNRLVPAKKEPQEDLFTIQNGARSVRRGGELPLESDPSVATTSQMRIHPT